MYNLEQSQFSGIREFSNSAPHYLRDGIPFLRSRPPEKRTTQCIGHRRHCLAHAPAFPPRLPNTGSFTDQGMPQRPLQNRRTFVRSTGPVSSSIGAACFCCGPTFLATHSHRRTGATPGPHSRSSASSATYTAQASEAWRRPPRCRETHGGREFPARGSRRRSGRGDGALPQRWRRLGALAWRPGAGDCGVGSRPASGCYRALARWRQQWPGWPWQEQERRGTMAA